MECTHISFLVRSRLVLQYEGFHSRMSYSLAKHSMYGTLELWFILLYFWTKLTLTNCVPHMRLGHQMNLCAQLVFGGTVVFLLVNKFVTWLKALAHPDDVPPQTLIRNCLRNVMESWKCGLGLQIIQVKIWLGIHGMCRIMFGWFLCVTERPLECQFPRFPTKSLHCSHD